MAMLIAHRQLQPNRWRIPEPAAAAAQAASKGTQTQSSELRTEAFDTQPVSNHTVQEQAEAMEPLLRMADWLARADEVALGQHAAVLLEPEDDPLLLAGRLSGIDAIAIRFPRFSDGRGYSIARMVRTQLGWGGPLIAVGDVMRDQLQAMSRCGFDHFQLREDQDPRLALAAFTDFSDAYQRFAATVPLFERRTTLSQAAA